ncbi:hypothetical protein HZA76_04670 [Candidatus Roizmanbacteria bacterium]|nr:hypothetical protein [Candidatus Roizmanbacteria bacterium]
MDDVVEKIKKEQDVFSKAKLIRFLLVEKDFRVKDLAQKLSITSSYLCHLNRLNNLPDIIVDGYYSKLVDISHLFLISRVKDEKKLLEIYEKVLADNLTIKQTEELIRAAVYQVNSKGSFILEEDKTRMSREIERKFPGAKISISQTRIKTKIELEIKGDLEDSSKTAKEILKKLTE